jgi:hypothetical protein
MLGLERTATTVRKLYEDNAPSHFRFYSDNQAACNAIVDRRPHNAQWASIEFRAAVDTLLSTHPDLTVVVQWFPGHMGLPGNERADTLAHEATIIEATPIFYQSLSYAKGRAVAEARASWNRHWDSASRSGHVRFTLPNPPSRRFKRPVFDFYPGNDSRENPDCPHTAPRYPRTVTCRFNQLVLGRCFTGEYYQRFNIDEELDCPCGHAPLQTIRHVLLDCRLHSEPRMLLRKVSRSLNLAVLFGTEKGREALLSFLAVSSAFRK